MNDGFGLVEVIIALTLALVVFSIIINSVFDGTTATKKLSENQQVLEAIFHTVDTIKSDLGNCGMRLQEASFYYNLKPFEHTDTGYKLCFGVTSGFLNEPAFQGNTSVALNQDEFFKNKKKVLIYCTDYGSLEYAEISQWQQGRLFLNKELKYDYAKNSVVLVLKEIEYRFFAKQAQLKRKVDRGNFQPLLDRVSDFFVSFFPESQSVLYRIEVNKKEQVRGYIFLKNMVLK